MKLKSRNLRMEEINSSVFMTELYVVVAVRQEIRVSRPPVAKKNYIVRTIDEYIALLPFKVH